MQATEVCACPALPEETAERCAMGWLEAEEAAAFRLHTRECPNCAAMLADCVVFARLLRSAMEEASGNESGKR